MASVKQALQTTTTAGTLTITLASLASAAARQSVLVDNTSNLYLDYMILFKTAAVSAATLNVDLYAVGALQTTSPVWTDGASGTDAAFTPLVNAGPYSARLIGSVPVNGTTVVTGGPWSIAKCFDGNIPPYWAVIVVNNTGVALHGTAGNHAIQYNGVYQTVV